MPVKFHTGQDRISRLHARPSQDRVIGFFFFGQVPDSLLHARDYHMMGPAVRRSPIPSKWFLQGCGKIRPRAGPLPLPRGRWGTWKRAPGGGERLKRIAGHGGFLIGGKDHTLSSLSRFFPHTPSSSEVCPGGSITQGCYVSLFYFGPADRELTCASSRTRLTPPHRKRIGLAFCLSAAREGGITQ